MSFNRLNKRQQWLNYCQEHKDLFKDLEINDWVIHSDRNFREFATNGFVSAARGPKYPFKNLNKED